MPFPATDTLVTYPDGATTSRGTVLHVEPLADGRAAVILDVTAFHPVDTAWPDQPADRGTLTTADGTQPIVDAVTGGIHEAVLHLGADLPVRTGTEGWVFVVAHVIDGTPPDIGEQVRVDVDAEYRAALSAAHTACHLAALALDSALADAWSKPALTDALGNPAFDALAIQQSRISPHHSVDTYRIGKSLRRKGFTVAALDDLDAVVARTDAQLAAWVAAGGQVRIARDDDGLSSRRTWICDLPEGSTDIPCGGTHVADIADISAVTTSLTKQRGRGRGRTDHADDRHAALKKREGRQQDGAPMSVAPRQECPGSGDTSAVRSHAVCAECRPSAISSMTFALNAGRSSGVRLVTRPGIDDDLLVDPVRPGVAQVGLKAGVARERAAVDHVGLDQRPRGVADGGHRLVLREERLRECHGVGIHPQVVGVHHAAGKDEGVELRGVGVGREHVDRLGVTVLALDASVLGRDHRRDRSRPR